jgi:hypothetical protein
MGSTAILLAATCTTLLLRFRRQLFPFQLPLLIHGQLAISSFSPFIMKQVP